MPLNKNKIVRAFGQKESEKITTLILFINKLWLIIFTLIFFSNFSPLLSLLATKGMMPFSKNKKTYSQRVNLFKYPLLLNIFTI